MGKTINKHWVFYTKFGLDLTGRGSNFVTTCPFCMKADHFSIKQDTGVYNCLRCGMNGNHYQFIRDFHQVCLAGTTEAALAELSDNRGIAIETLKLSGLARSPNGNWLLPSRNEEGAIMNLYQAVQQRSNNGYQQDSRNDSGHYQIQPGPDSSNRIPIKRPPVPPIRSFDDDIKYSIESAPDPCSQILYGLEQWNNQPTVTITEGHWDRQALWEVFAWISPVVSRNSGCWDWDIQINTRPDYYGPIFREIWIAGTPGANQFKPEWVKYLKNKNVILIYDNDKDRVICAICRGMDGYKAHPNGMACPICGGYKTTGQIINPGRDGIAKVLKELDQSGTPVNSLLQVKWLPSDPKDIRDLMKL